MDAGTAMLLLGAAISATLLVTSRRALYRGIALSANTLCLAGISRTYQVQPASDVLALLGIACAVYAIAFLLDSPAEATMSARWPSCYGAYGLALLLWGALCAALVASPSPWEVLPPRPDPYPSRAPGYWVLLLFAGVALSILSVIAWLRRRGQG